MPRSQSQPTRRRALHTPNPFTRRLRVEPLEDRRMLSLTLFVDADAAEGGDGLSWETAFRDLQDGLTEAETRNGDDVGDNDVDAIWVAEGVYKPSNRLETWEERSVAFSLPDGVTIYGGFAGTETTLNERDWSTHRTILSGDIGVIDDSSDNATTVVYCASSVESTLDGVLIVDGYAHDSGWGDPERRHGAGIYNEGTLSVRNSELSHNSAEDYGGAIYNIGTLTVVKSTLTENSADEGGGIYASDGSSDLTTVLSCVFSGNTAELLGGGIYHRGYRDHPSTLKVANSTFSGNSAGSVGGAIYSSAYATLTVDNSTLAGNSAIRGGGIYSFEAITLANSIVAANVGDNLLGGISEESHNNLIGFDPGFVRDPGTDGPDDYGDLRLTAQSGAIGAGEAGLLPEDTWDIDGDGDTGEVLPVDVDGNSRIFGVLLDIGAYEYQSPAAEDREIASTVVTTSDDVFDLYDGRISLRDAIFYARSDSPEASVTFAPELSGATIVLEGSSISIEGGATIDASSLAEGLTIDGDGRSRVFDVLNPSDRSVELVGLTVTNGCAPQAAGIYNGYGTLTLRDCIVRANVASDDNGGGIYSHYGTLSIIGSEIRENETDGSGGGIYNCGGELAVVNSSFLGNSAGRDYCSGGGIRNINGTLTIANSVFSRNTSYYSAGISSHSGVATIVNSTISGNDAFHSVGGIGASSSNALTLINSIVALNRRENLEASLSAESRGNLIGLDPRFVRNPGTDGDSDYGDFRLTSESPAINVGETTQLPADTADIDDDGDIAKPLPVDLDGNPRVFGTYVDIGAYETANLPSPGREVPSTTVDTTEDVFDLHDGRISLRDAIYYARTSQPTQAVTFAPELSGATVVLQGSGLCLGEGITIDAASLAGGLTVASNGGNRVFTVLATSEQVELVGLTISNGYADIGGGIYNAGLLTISKCKIIGNTADDGGGICNAGSLTVANSMVFGNEANGSYAYGGGIYCTSGTLAVSNSAIVGNAAIGGTDFGGGIFNRGGKLVVTNCTISGNRADKGGGICSDGWDADTKVRNTIIAENSASFSGNQNVYRDRGSYSAAYSLIDVDPRFVRAPSDGGDGWGDDPRTSQVDESANDDYGDLRLRPDSSGIDTGRDSYLPQDAVDLDGDGDVSEVIPYDLAGNSRIEGSRVDIGAYEFFAVPPIPGDLNNDGFVSSDDLNIVRANWGQSVPAGSLFDGDPSGDGVVNSDDLNIVRANWGSGVPAASVGVDGSPGAIPEIGSASPRREPAPAPTAERAAVFANARTLAEAAWAEAIDGLKRQAKRRQAAAVDLAMLAWGDCL